MSFSQGAIPSQEEMCQITQPQQKEIELLKQKLNMVEDNMSSTDQKVEMIADMPTSGKSPSWADKTSVGGYSELHFNNLVNKTRNNGAGDRDRIDFHRFVLLFGYEFSDRIRFFSEFKLEHGLVKDNDNDTAAGAAITSPGEVELEQARY